VGALAGTPYTLHPVQATGSDHTVKSASYTTGTATFTVPARTVAVFTR
ncbi:alpha-1,6-glucosidase domain-containing protein, partial [Streptomyces lavenduligriseus]